MEMEEILNDPKFQKTLERIAQNQNLDLDEVKKEAAVCLKELYTVHNPVGDMFGYEIAQYILGRGYDRTIDVRSGEIKKLTKLIRNHPVAFVMTHKTYIDMFVLAVVLWRHGLPLPYTFAGINMSFFGLGQIGRQVGSIFIRRSFRDNEVYKGTLRHFIATLVNDNSDFMWALEGTRSRTGKLVWPKLGILKYIAEAEQNTKKEVKYVPVSIVYDLIPDVKKMTEEGRGAEKSAESLSWFVDYVRKMGDELGKISLRFGAPIDHAHLPTNLGEDSLELYGSKQVKKLPRFALELAYRINEITPVTTTSLVCATMLSKFSITKRVLESDVASLMALIESHNPTALVDRGKPIGESVQIALNLLINADIVRREGAGLSAKYMIVSSNYLSAVYYANMAVHLLVNRSFVELALARIEHSAPDTRQLKFWQEVMDLRDLFKFEFFYSRKPVFSDEIEEDLDFLLPNWQKEFGSVANLDVLQKQQILVSHAVLYPYVESYKVVAQKLLQWNTNDEFNEKDFLRGCIALGEEMNWQGKVRRVEAVSKPFLQNGLRLAQNRGLVPTADDDKQEGLRKFIQQLDDITERLTDLQAITLDRPKEEQTAVPFERDVVPGTRLTGVTTDVMSSEEGSHIGAFFDLDRTLINVFSAKDFFQTLLTSGVVGPREIATQFVGSLVYVMGNQNFAGLAAVSVQGVKGTEERLFIEVGEDVYMKHLAQAIYPESRALVAAHMAKGHTVAIISAATPYQVDPIARDLGIEHVMCTRMEVENGKFTGNIIEPACWGEGKAMAARELAEEHGLDLSKSYFYTDSAADMPLLDIVGRPRPLNPDTKLSAAAFENGWPVARFDDEERPGPVEIARTAMLAGSLIPAVAAGVASGAMNLSWQDGINTMTAMVGDLGTSLAGIELVVKGEENLWAQRPAVFIFNHQSSADLFIGAKLLRKDIRAIAKQELRFTPIGPMLMAAGVVFIDRKNRNKAIEAMKPAVEALQNGMSIAIAPEGTRSYDYDLGKFKKGAFHLAMQARVPIVPMIIRNAHDVMPRGSSLVRSRAVEVIVLPPISTDDWKVETIDEHVSAVRALFLHELGQDQERPTAVAQSVLPPDRNGVIEAEIIPVVDETP